MSATLAALFSFLGAGIGAGATAWLTNRFQSKRTRLDIYSHAIAALEACLAANVMDPDYPSKEATAGLAVSVVMLVAPDKVCAATHAVLTALRDDRRIEQPLQQAISAMRKDLSFVMQ